MAHRPNQRHQRPRDGQTTQTTPTTESRAPKRQGLLPELPVLAYNHMGSPNLIDWRRDMETYATQHYAELGHIFREGKYRDFTFPPVIPMPANQDLTEARWKKIQDKQIERLLSERQDMERDKVKLYGAMIGNVSHESLDALMRSPEWLKVDEDKDPLNLWTLIKSTHLVSNSSVGNEDIARADAREKYNTLRQRPGEPLSQFYERYKECIERFSSVRQKPPEDIDQAWDFIRKLDKAKYESLERKLRNDLVTGSQINMKTLADAYRIACTFVASTPERRISASTVFTTHQITQGAPRGQAQYTHQRNQSGRGRESSGRAFEGRGREPSCSLCDQRGHWTSDCPQLQEFKNKKREQVHTNRARFNDGVTEFTLTTMEKCFPIGGVDDPNIVLLDNEATRSVFRNAALLGELGPCAPVTFGGINASEDSTIQARQKGILPGFGPVLYSEEAAVNALSWSSLVDAGLQLGYNADEDYFFVTDVHGDTHKFRRFGNLYGKIFDTHKAYATVENNRKLYTQRQLHGADRARDLERKMGFLPIGGISPSIINCPVTLHDIQRASEIYGRSIPSIKGKDRRAHQHTDVQERLDMDIDTELTLHVDLMYIESIPFFVSVSVPLGLTLLTHLGFAIGSRAKKPILAALDSQIKGYKSQRFSVIGIVSDGEGAITSLQSEINAMGVHVNINAPGQHVSIVERKIQTIKDVQAQSYHLFHTSYPTHLSRTASHSLSIVSTCYLTKQVMLDFLQENYSSKGKLTTTPTYVLVSVIMHRCTTPTLSPTQCTRELRELLH